MDAMPEHRGSTEPTTDIRWPRARVAQVILGGEHDLSSAEHLNGILAETLDWCSKLIVDLRGTQFIDASTIRVLLSVKGRAIASGRAFSIVLATTPIVERTLEITGVLSVLNRVHTLEQALSDD